jgi:predicted transcriptional regulator
MDASLRDVTDAELAVLQSLWEHGPATIRLLTDRLYPAGSETHYATVQKLLDRLEAKQHVARDRSGHAHVFRAVTDRDTLLGHRLRAMAERLCGGLLGPLVTHLVRAENLSAEERQELRTLIDELGRPSRPRNKQR